MQSYFQNTDIERYIKIIEATLVRAIGQYLDERGYSVVEFTRLADPTINNFTVHGNVIGSALGTRNTVQTNREAAAAVPKGKQ